MKWNFDSRLKIFRYPLAAFVIAAIVLWALRPAPLVVEVAPVTKGEFRQEIIEEGETRPRDRFIVRATVGGYLQRLSWKVGDRIKKGERVCTIYPNQSMLLDKRTFHELNERIKSLRSTYESAKVLVGGAQIAYKTAQADYQRNAVLAKRGFVSKSEMDHQRLAMELKKNEVESLQYQADRAQHDVEEAKATLTRQQSKLTSVSENFEVVLAPSEGEVLVIDRKSEGPIEVGALILSIADVNRLEIVVDILSTDAVQIEPGDSVTIERWGGQQPLQGKVRLVEPGGYMKISALGVEEQRVNVVIDLVSPREQWLNLGSEFRVEAHIVVFKESDVLQVPVSALFRQEGRWAVFVLKGGKAYSQSVELGRRNAQAAIIIAGLKEGDNVILYPGERVAEGVRAIAQQRD